MLIIEGCDALPADTLSFIAGLAAGPSNSRVIATAAHPLNIVGECVVELAPLQTPASWHEPPALALQRDALQLLFTRLRLMSDPRGIMRQRRAPVAWRIARDRTTIPDNIAMATRIARHAGGVPLALELAAAAIARRVRAGDTLEVTLIALARELDAACAGQTARGEQSDCASCVTVALELCIAGPDDRARLVFRRLGVFADTFTRDAALDMLNSFPAEPDLRNGVEPQAVVTLDSWLSELAEVSLVERLEHDGAIAFRMIQPVRAHALALLRQAGESDAAGTAHARAVLASYRES